MEAITASNGTPVPYNTDYFIPEIGSAAQLEELYESRIWMGTDGASRINFQHPSEIIEPFLYKLEDTGLTYDLKIRAAQAVKNRNADTGEVNTSFGRVSVEANIERPDSINHEAFHDVVGLVYAFDMQKPEIIIYQGRNARACLNLTIFGAEQVLKLDYLTQSRMAIDSLGRLVNTVGQDDVRFAETVDRLQNTVLTREGVHELSGRLLFHLNGNASSFGTAALNHAVKMLASSNSRYALAPDGSTTAWNYFNALTDFIGEKTYVNVRATKSLQMAQFFLGDE